MVTLSLDFGNSVPTSTNLDPGTAKMRHGTEGVCRPRGRVGKKSPRQAKFQPSRGGTSVAVKKKNTQG